MNLKKQAVLCLTAIFLLCCALSLLAAAEPVFLEQAPEKEAEPIACK